MFPPFPPLLLASSSHRIPAPEVHVIAAASPSAGIGGVSLALGKRKVAALPSWPLCLGGSRPQPPLAVRLEEGSACPTPQLQA